MNSLKLLRSGRIEKIKNPSGKNNIFEFDFGSEKGLTRKQIEMISNKYSKQIAKINPNFKVQVELRYDNEPRGNNWFSGYHTDAGSKVKLYNPLESNSDRSEEYKERLLKTKKFTRFTILFYKTSVAGGCDEGFNDCLYLRLKELVEHMPREFASGRKMKEYFKLERNALIPIDKLNEVSNMIGMQIRLTGEQTAVYGDFNKAICLRLSNNHYSNAPTENVTLKTVSLYSKKDFLIFTKDKETYSREGYKINQDAEISDAFIKTKFGKQYAPLYINTRTIEETLRMPYDSKLEDVYHRLNIIADNLMDITDGYIDLHKCNGKLKSYALQLFEESLRFYFKSDPIDEIESSFIHIGGGLMFSQEYEGYCYEYDLNQAYSKTLTSQLNISLQKPEYEIFDQQKYISKKGNEYYPYGLYKCRIIKSDDEETNKLFAFHPYNLYTHIDLILATQLNLKIIFDDTQCNYARYDKKMQCKTLFYDFVSKLLEYEKHPKLLKESKPVLKHLRNVLWGALCEKNKQVSHPDASNNLIVDLEKWNVHHFYKNENDDGTITRKCEYTPKNQVYQHNFARIGAFITSTNRKMLSCIIQKVGKNNIVRSHTDSIFSKIPLHFEDSDELGRFKLKTKGIIKINNTMSYEWIKKEA